LINAVAVAGCGIFMATGSLGATIVVCGGSVAIVVSYFFFFFFWTTR
jgi:hypothetical protein